MYIFMTPYNTNANLTAIITEARSTPNTLYTAPNFLNYEHILWSKIAKLSSRKWSTEHPQKMHPWMYTFTSILLLNNEHCANPPLSRSDRGPSGGPVPKVFRKRAPRANKHTRTHDRRRQHLVELRFSPLLHIHSWRKRTYVYLNILRHWSMCLHRKGSQTCSVAQ
jgi:hypothetical protein